MNNLGVYYPAYSFWHAIDPRTKLLVVIFLVVISLMVSGMGWLGLLIILFLIFLTSRLPLSLPFQLFWKFKWLLLITFAANLLVPVISHNIWSSINRNFFQAAVTFGRLSLMLMIATWLSWVTRPMALVEGISRLLKPLARLKAPVVDISLVMTLILRFIPELLTESENIMVAQRVRGVKPQLTWKNSRLWIQSTIIPLFILSIHKSVAMATAMEARGFRPGAPRTSMEKLTFQIGDYVVIGLVGVAIIGWVMLQFI